MTGLLPILFILLAPLQLHSPELRYLSALPAPVGVAGANPGPSSLAATDSRPDAQPISDAIPLPVLQDSPADASARATGETGAAQSEVVLDGGRPVPLTPVAPDFLLPVDPPRNNPIPPPAAADDSFRWGPALGSTILAIGAQNLCNLTSARFRNELEGPFFADWFESAGALFDSNWSDGNKFQTNYIAHPIAGAVYANNARRNDPKYAKLRPGDPGYATGVFRSMAFAAGASLMFEIGPLSEASIGNLGLRNPDKQGWVDPVMTPILGAGWMVLEDVVKQHVLFRVHDPVAYSILHVFLNPARTFSNLFNFRNPCPR